MKPKYPAKQILRATIANLAKELGGKIGGVYRIETPADDALTGELAGQLENPPGALVLVSRGSYNERPGDTVRSDDGTFPVTLFLCVSDKHADVVPGEYFTRQQLIAEALDDLEESADHAMDIVAGPFKAPEFLVMSIRRLPLTDQQASYAAAGGFVRPIEYEFMLQQPD